MHRLLRFTLARLVQPVVRSRNRAQISRQNPVRPRIQDRALLLDVRPETLQHEDHPGCARLRGEAEHRHDDGGGDGGEECCVQSEG